MGGGGWSLLHKLLFLLAVLPLLCLSADLETHHATMVVGAGAGLLAGANAATSWLCRLLGVRLCFVVDEHGGPILRLVRVGAPVRGLAAGALLVATNRVGGGFFEKTVIVLTRHDQAGSVGLVVNVPISHPTREARMAAQGAMGYNAAFDDGPPLRHALALPEAPEAVWHGVGGPVDITPMASAVIHAFSEDAGNNNNDNNHSVPGATPLFERPFEPHERPSLFVGGDLATLRERASRAVQGGGRAEREGEVRRVQRSAGVLMRVLHGHAAWAPGQLEGEIHAAAWTWAADLGEEFALGLRGAQGIGQEGAGVWWGGPYPERDAVWERALRRVAEVRREGRAAGRGEIGNLPARLEPTH